MMSSLVAFMTSEVPTILLPLILKIKNNISLNLSNTYKYIYKCSKQNFKIKCKS